MYRRVRTCNQTSFSWLKMSTKKGQLLLVFFITVLINLPPIPAKKFVPVVQQGSNALQNASDLVTLTDANFTQFVSRNRYVMAKFYASWCHWSRSLGPEYAAAASQLRGRAMLAEVDATLETALAEEYNIDGYPMMKLFVSGLHLYNYYGQRKRDAIVSWVERKMSPGVINITTSSMAADVLRSDELIVLAYLNSLEDPESREMAAASVLETETNLYQVSSSEIAQKNFYIDPESSRPSLFFFSKNDAARSIRFDGEFIGAAIAKFVLKKKLALISRKRNGVGRSRKYVNSLFEFEL